MTPQSVERLEKTLARVAKEQGVAQERLRRRVSFLALCGVLERAVGEGILESYDLKGGVALELRFAGELKLPRTLTSVRRSLLPKLVVQSQSQPHNIASIPFLTATFVRPVHPVARGSHHEDFGTVGNGSPARPLRTWPARNSAKGTMSSPTLARSRALI
jgi:hypothetical protein